MKALAPDDRPREKLDRCGACHLGDNELVAVVLGHGFHRTTALELANRVLEAVRGVHGLTRAPRDDLGRIKGIGRAKAAQVLAAIELGRRTLTRAPAERSQFVNARDIAAYLLPQFGSRPVEQFGVMLLDTKLRLLKTALVSVGTLDASLVHPREVFRAAAVAGAAAVVLFHNHPSGDPTPSRDDVGLTARLVAAGEVMGIDVVDHLVLADTKYCSFKETGRLQR